MKWCSNDFSDDFVRSDGKEYQIFKEKYSSPPNFHVYPVAVLHPPRLVTLPPLAKEPPPLPPTVIVSVLYHWLFNTYIIWVQIPPWSGNVLDTSFVSIPSICENGHSHLTVIIGHIYFPRDFLFPREVFLFNGGTIGALLPPLALSSSSPPASSSARRVALWKVGSKVSAMLLKWPPGSWPESHDSNICGVRAWVFAPLFACHNSS